MEWHIITGEFPPVTGGVSDYSGVIAAGLASAGETVHVWCPASIRGSSKFAGVQVHDSGGSWTGADLVRLDAALNRTPAPRRLLVQWVPHLYGRRSLNLAFCRWLRRRGRCGDHLELMVHEPYLAFGEGLIRQDIAAAVQRAMVMLLLSAAQRVWVAIPAWADHLRSWTLGRSIPFCWLPVPSTVPVAPASEAVADHRKQLLRGSDGIIAGHFGTYSKEVRGDLRKVLPRVLDAAPEIQVLLLGRGSQEALQELCETTGTDRSRVVASGPLGGLELSYHLQACDLMMQPYIDGASTRRTTLMAALAHGRPVVTTTGRLSEAFWTGCEAITAVPAGDAAAMVQSTVALARDPERRRQLSVAAKCLYDRRFGLPNVIHALRSPTCTIA